MVAMVVIQHAIYAALDCFDLPTHWIISYYMAMSIGLDKLYYFLPIIFLIILKNSAYNYYSSLVYPLFQFKDITLILKRQLILFVVVL